MPRCFVVGNGASLKNTNLSLLKNDISIACNNVQKIYPFTDWRPSIYVRAEEAGTLGPEDWQESVDTHTQLGCEMWLNDHFVHGDKSKAKIKSCAHYRRHFDNPNCPHLLHLPILCTFGSSVNVAVQIAMLKELSPIYLVGCDLDADMNHFSESYRHGKEQANRYAQLDALEAHIIAARSRYPIFNATVGGNLEVYERVALESLYSG